MANGTTLNSGSGGDKIATQDYGDANGKLTRVEIMFGGNSGSTTNGTAASATAPIPTYTADAVTPANKGKVGVGGDQMVSVGGATLTAIAAATPTAVKASAGRLCRIAIITLGTAAVNLYDNASAATGTILFTIPASAAVGTVYDLQFPAVNGIYYAGTTSSPAVNVTFY